MKKTLAVIMTVLCMFAMTACSSGAGNEALQTQQEEAAESSFMASDDTEIPDEQGAEDQSETSGPAEKAEGEKSTEPTVFEFPEIDELDRGTSFWFNSNEEGLIITYEDSGNEYLVARFNEDENPRTAFHELYGYQYIYSNGVDKHNRDFYYMTMSDDFGNAIHYVNLDERTDTYICPGWLHESVALGPFEGMLLVQIEEGDGDGSMNPGIYLINTDGIVQEFFGDSYDPSFIQTGKHKSDEAKEESEPEPQAQPQPEVSTESQVQAPPETPIEPEEEEEKPIAVSEGDTLTVNTLYESDLSGNGQSELFFLTADEDEGVFLLINEEVQQLSNIYPGLMNSEYRIVDLNPGLKGKELEILEADPPYDECIHFVRVTSDYSGDHVQAIGPLSVPFETFNNDRVLYQGNDQIMVIEMSNIITAFYQKFYRIERGVIQDESRPDITKYMTPFRTTMTKGVLAFPTDHYTDSGSIYLDPGDEIIIHGEHKGNLWIEYLGETSSEFYWILGTMIDHYPDANGQYLFTGVQFWS